MKSIIYYTDNRVAEPIFSICQKYIEESGLPIVSTSLRPINFGRNIIVEGVHSYPTMVKQILVALEFSESDHVFFCEHDVLYHKSHFDFTPPKDNIFYYNTNVWRWRYWRETGDDMAIKYDRMIPLSCLCVNTKFALNHYRMRQQKIEEWGLSEFRSREPRRGRIWGYEPGTKKKRRGGFSDDDYDVWTSEYPVVDIRHEKTFSRLKCTLDEFKHKPTNWQEIPIDKIPGWNLRKLFNL